MRDRNFISVSIRLNWVSWQRTNKFQSITHHLIKEVIGVIEMSRDVRRGLRNISVRNSAEQTKLLNFFNNLHRFVILIHKSHINNIVIPGEGHKDRSCYRSG